MRARLAMLTAAAASTMLLAGCSESVTDEGVEEFITEVQAYVPSANAYTDDTLRSIASNVCTLGNVDQAVQVLDNYSQIEPEDYEEVARIALDTACAEE